MLNKPALASVSLRGSPWPWRRWVSMSSWGRKLASLEKWWDPKPETPTWDGKKGSFRELNWYVGNTNQKPVNKLCSTCQPSGFTRVTSLCPELLRGARRCRDAPGSSGRGHAVVCRLFAKFLEYLWGPQWVSVFITISYSIPLITGPTINLARAWARVCFCFNYSLYN